MILGNPAQRLHDILVAFDDASGTSATVNDCWQAALGCSAGELGACFQSAMSLIPEIRARIESQGVVTQQAVVDRFESSWLKPFMPDRGWHQHSRDLIEQESLLALSSLSEIFSSLEPPAIVDAQKSQTLLGLLDAARAAVREDDGLPPALRTAILDRLHDVQWAVDHYSIHGPEGLQAALDRLGAELVRSHQHGGAWRGKVGKAFLFGCLLFSHASAFQANLEATDTFIHEVGDWIHDARDLIGPHHGELPPGPADEGVVDGELVDDDGG